MKATTFTKSCDEHQRELIRMLCLETWKVLSYCTLIPQLRVPASFCLIQSKIGVWITTDRLFVGFEVQEPKSVNLCGTLLHLRKLRFSGRSFVLHLLLA